MYHTSRPVKDELFHDRTGELARLRHSIERLRAGSPEWIALLGRRKVGKTSLLLEFERTLPETGVHTVLIDAFEQAPISLDLFRVYAARVLDAVHGAAAGRSFEALMAMDPAAYRAALVGSPIFERIPPALRPVLLELPSVELNAGSLRLLLDLPEQLAQAEGVHIVAAWDEFQEIATWSGRSRPPFEILPLLRATWQRHERVSYVVSGSAPSVIRELVTSRKSPFFQHFALMELGEMARPDALGLLAAGGVRGDVAERAVDLLGGQPFYLQLLGEELLALGEPWDEPTFKEAVQQLLFQRTGRLALYFDREFHAAVGQSSLLARLLEGMAEAGRDGARLTDLARAIRSPSGATRGYIERLGDVVERNEVRYRLADPVFGLWLRWRSPAGGAVPMAVIGDAAEREVAQALARLGFELVYQSRASRGAFDLLARRGGDALGVQVKRSPLPLAFDQEAWARMEGEAARLRWRWVVAQVGDGVRFLDPAQARRGKTARLGEEAGIDNLLLWLQRGG